MPEAPFPDGKIVAVTTSWDGGYSTDRKMGQMLEQYGYRGTFYLVPDNLGKDGFLTQDDVKTLMASGHEIGLHGDAIADFGTLPPDDLTAKLKDAKAALESITGSPVVSLAYPNGGEWQKAALVEAVGAAGFDSARTTHSMGGMTLETLRDAGKLRLPVSAFYKEDFGTVQMGWMEIEETVGGVYHFWGRSQELGENPLDWVDFECILGFLGGISNVWYGSVKTLAASL
jgi:peptidoglycan/xylan/chitin deacetylase (PgdA/CDA1 family)